MKYVRDAKKAINLGLGLSYDLRSALSMLIDLMVIHRETGIPVEPPSYIAGLLGLGQKSWQQTIKPKLIAARKLKVVRRGGIDVYELAGQDEVIVSKDAPSDEPAQKFEERKPPRFMDRDVFSTQHFSRPGQTYPRPCETVEVEDDPVWDQQDTSSKKGNLGNRVVLDDMAKKMGVTEESLKGFLGMEIHADDRVPDDKAVIVGAKGEVVVVDGIGDSLAPITPAPPAPDPVEAPPETRIPQPIKPVSPPETVPKPNAFVILTQAGIDAEEHPKGEFYWLRSEHNQILDRWLERIPANEIVARLARAEQNGELPKHPTTLEAFEGAIFN